MVKEHINIKMETIIQLLNKFQGSFVNGKPNGQGIMNWFESGEVYQVFINNFWVNG